MSAVDLRIRPVTNRADNGYPRVITIISASRCSRIRIEEIESIEQDGRILHITTTDKEYSVYESINVIAEMLDPACFYRPMKGLIINFDKVMEVSLECITFESGRITILGRNKLSMTKNAFKKYIMEYPPFISNGETLKVAEEIH